MAQVTLILILLLAVVASSVVSRLVPLALPRPLVQIAMGAVIGAATGAHVAFDPDVFFLLFIPPLLFLDGWRIPKDAVYRDRKPILGLALGLVFLTVIGMGYFIHGLIPAMPLGVAFALAAVISPTDPIAVSAIAQRTPVPGRLMHILEGESLLNDASGLVCLRFALAAVMTGSFSLTSAFGSFLWMAIGGIAIGAGLAFVVVRGKSLAGLRFGDDPGSNILIGMLIPFVAYIAADKAGTSGILAVVAAGMMMSYAVDSTRDLASTRIRSRVVWDMMQFALNGVIFVLLGNQLPVILSGLRVTAAQGGHREPAWLALYVVVIVAALGLLRFGWTWLSLQLTLFRARRRNPDVSSPPIRIVAATTVAGARGAITLAGVLTFPLALSGGDPFPARNLAIFIAMGVIMVSLVIAGIGLPLLLGGLKLPAADDGSDTEDDARIAAAHAAIRRVEDMADDGETSRAEGNAAARVIDLYRARIERLSPGEDADIDRVNAAERELHIAAMEAERETIAALRRDGTITHSFARELTHELDLRDVRVT